MHFFKNIYTYTFSNPSKIEIDLTKNAIWILFVLQLCFFFPSVKNTFLEKYFFLFFPLEVWSWVRRKEIVNEEVLWNQTQRCVKSPLRIGIYLGKKQQLTPLPPPPLPTLSPWPRVFTPRFMTSPRSEQTRLMWSYTIIFCGTKDLQTDGQS